MSLNKNCIGSKTNFTTRLKSILKAENMKFFNKNKQISKLYSNPFMISKMITTINYRKIEIKERFAKNL